MTNDEREQLIRFCISATAELHGVSEELVSKEKVFIVMSDEELTREADWLDDLLDK